MGVAELETLEYIVWPIGYTNDAQSMNVYFEERMTERLLCSSPCELNLSKHQTTN